MHVGRPFQTDQSTRFAPKDPRLRVYDARKDLYSKHYHDVTTSRYLLAVQFNGLMTLCTR